MPQVKTRGIGKIVDGDYMIRFDDARVDAAYTQAFKHNRRKADGFMLLYSPTGFCPSCGELHGVIAGTVGDRLKIACIYCNFEGSLLKSRWANRKEGEEFRV